MEKHIKFNVSKLTATQMTATRGGKAVVLSEALSFSGSTVSEEYSTLCTGTDHDSRGTDSD